MAGEDDRMVIGEIVGVFGVRGEIKVDPFTDVPERFEQVEQIVVGPTHRSYAVERARPHKGHILLKLEGVDLPEAAARLRGQEISIPRTDLDPLPDGHYYLEDLIGVEVSTSDGKILGLVDDVLRTGSNDVYVVGRGRDSILIPGIKDAITALDLPARKMVVEPWVLQPEEG